MKNLIVLFSVLFFWGCKKNKANIENSTDLSITNARSYFEKHPVKNNSSNPRFSNTRTVYWDNASKINFNNGVVVVAPVQYLRNFYMRSNLDTTRYFSSNENTWICMYVDSQKLYHIEQLAFFPDKNFKKGSAFTGLVSVDDFAGNAIIKYKIEQNNIFEWQPPATQATVKLNSINPAELSVTEICYEYSGYNYSVDDPDNGTYWSEFAGCSYVAVKSVGNTSSGSGAIAAVGGGVGKDISPAANFTVLSGNNIIANIVDYNKCFTNIAGSGNTFSVTICVEQPEPGTRTSWVVSGSGAAGSSAGSNPVNVGHTFLIFTQQTGSGIITRNIGFYPKTNVNPISPSAQGILNNNAGDQYDISLTVSVTNSQFFNMLNYVSQGNNAGFNYDLNTNNCTTFALNTLSAGNINLPRTIGSWWEGTGNDPGDLGEDIRSLNLSPGMTRNTTDPAHPNVGSCN
jgi:hypothetical protein